MLPLERRAQVCSPPAATSTASVTPATSIGAGSLGVTAPLPTWPFALFPQQNTLPGDPTSAHVCASPAVICVTPCTPVTTLGVISFVSVAFPSCPSTFSPQQDTVASASSAHA